MNSITSQLHALCKTSKRVHDVLYKSIELSRFAVEIIDTLAFQRLRNLKQLGLCSYIYPNANHTRFEHVIGTYFVAKKFTEALLKNSHKDQLRYGLEKVPELQSYFDMRGVVEFDDYVRELICIAALCHDLGHGPLSHLFDELCGVVFPENNMSKHEVRSQVILEHIVSTSQQLSIVPHDHIALIQKLIHPKSSDESFIYQIVSNELNSIDIDKFDYINRDTNTTGVCKGFDYDRFVSYACVIENKVAYPEQCTDDIKNMFTSRHCLFRKVYQHKKVIMLQHMVSEYMSLLDHHFIRIYDSINNVNEFICLDDVILMKYFDFIKLNKSKFVTEKNAKHYARMEYLMECIQRHQFYRIVGYVTSPTMLKFDTNAIENELLLEEGSLHIHSTLIGFVSGKKANPLDSLAIYKTQDVAEGIYKLVQWNKLKITNLVPHHAQEYVYYAYILKTKAEINKDIMRNLKCTFAKYIMHNYEGAIVE